MLRQIIFFKPLMGELFTMMAVYKRWQTVGLKNLEKKALKREYNEATFNYFINRILHRGKCGS